MLARFDGLAKRRDISTGKNIFARKRIRRSRFAHPSDCVEQHHAVIFHQIRYTSEKCFEIRSANMFKHPNRNDPVKLPSIALCKVAIVDKLELHLIRYTFITGPLLRDFQLFLAERNAEHLNTKFLMQVKRHTAPSAADIKHTLARM